MGIIRLPMQNCGEPPFFTTGMIEGDKNGKNSSPGTLTDSATRSTSLSVSMNPGI